MNNDRQKRLVPSGIPRYVRCYDNQGDTADRYTVVFTGRYRKGGEEFIYLEMSNNPFHPMGIGMHGFSQDLIDRPGYSHLGKKVSFEALPEKVQQCVMQTYNDLWDLNVNEKSSAA